MFSGSLLLDTRHMSCSARIEKISIVIDRSYSPSYTEVSISSKSPINVEVTPCLLGQGPSKDLGSPENCLGSIEARDLKCS